MLSNPSMIAISMIWLGWSTTVVCARLYTRFLLVRNPGPDDYLIILSWALASTFSILIPVQVKYGLGKDAWNLSPEQYKDYLKPFWASVLVYTISLNVTKMSILQQYLRFFTGKVIRRATWVIFWVVVVYTITTSFLCIFTCNPPSFFWTKAVNPKTGHCLNELGLWFAQASFNILSDLTIIILPMKSLYQIHLPKRQKYALMMVFAIGFVVCCISIVRLQSLFSISNSTNATRDNVSAATWSTCESQTAIICASLPALRPLMTKVFPNISTTSGSRSFESGKRPRRRDGYSETGHRLDSVQGKAAAQDNVEEATEDGRIKVVTVLSQETEDSDMPPPTNKDRVLGNRTEMRLDV